MKPPLPDTLGPEKLRRSAFVHLIDLGDGITLVIQAVTQIRLTVALDVVTLIQAFDTPRDPLAAAQDLAGRLGSEPATILTWIRLLLDHEILTSAAPEAEATAVATALAPVHGRDPNAALDRLRRASRQGAHPYWSVTAPRTLTGARAFRHRLEVLLLGDCDIQMEADFLRQEAAQRGIDLRVAASFVTDVALAAEHPHDAVLIGALKSRHAIPVSDPVRVYTDEAADLLDRLRAVTAAPILIDGLPEPTVQPLGLAERGLEGHRNRFRRANLALAELADTRPGVCFIDTAATLAEAGTAALLDDGLVGFTHFGSAGWMLQRPASERAAVHDIFPDMAPLAEAVGGDPYRRERLMARAHLDALTTLLGLERKKCVIVDLDGVLWPGVLAETGRPFAWAPDVSGPYSFIGLYFGIHEALRTLLRRGILLACVSKNDEETVRALWQYGPDDPRHRLLSLDHFVATRINWRDKAENIRDIAAELGFPLEAFVFIDDTARERERVRQALPEVTVLGENLFALRRTLLSDPRLQIPHVTEEAARRHVLVKAQLDRTRLRESMPDPAAFLASLQVTRSVRRLTAEDSPALERVCELFARTTQFNTTGMSFSDAELRAVISRDDGRVFVLRLRDRLGDHGLVGAAVVIAGEILNLAISCRVIGLGGETALLAAIAADPGGGAQVVRGRIVPTGRNLPARHVYADNGYTGGDEGSWERPVAGGIAG